MGIKQAGEFFKNSYQHENWVFHDEKSVKSDRNNMRFLKMIET